MSTQRMEFETHFLQMPGEVHVAGPPDKICMSIRVRAEARRLFQALVVPEYLETWLRIPGAGSSCSLVAMEPARGFVLECGSQKPVRLFASYTLWRRRRVGICWRLERNQAVKESFVALRLTGDFEFTVLSLCHTGLGSAEELAWHHRLWAESLNRLRGLFQGITVDGGLYR
jgi:hypothetical protein